MVWDPTRWEQGGHAWPESAFVDEAFCEVRTAHDLRGLAIMLERALEKA